ncbi:MAG TPA: NAD-dependent epimerase/dehydratase family protein [Polyangiaceae bacterium]|jgi:nucleoside-diphosphate-sugar epimerase|nr:NAD-dependent epimerase/dehydratase family protein [Polyangiaceae bacterium]
MTYSRVLVLGCGYTGTRVARAARARGTTVIATLRNDGGRERLEAIGVHVLVSPELDERIGEEVNETTHVVIAFPPDGETDARVAPTLAAAHSIAYVSSTGVYGERRGEIDDTTPLPDPPAERARRILDAEAIHRAHGATVLRCPGIYGPDRGLHMRILRGEHRIPGDGSRILSRIHVEDLAELLLAAAAVRGETFVVGDLAPAPHIDVVRFVCETYGVPLPPSVPLGDVHDSLRADRKIDASRALARLGVTLRYPDYRVGMAPAATGITAPR